jgi:hypothetical protein
MLLKRSRSNEKWLMAEYSAETAEMPKRNV